MTFYVSSHGRDSNPGTINKPLATLEKARDLVRTRLTSGQKDTITVFLREGNYTLKNTFELNNSDSGRENLPIIYSAYPNEKVSIKGGISIPVEKAVKVKDKEVLSRLIPTVKEKILQINLKSLNIHNYGVLSPRGFSRPYQPAPMELFCNYNEMKLSRWPNDSLIRIGKVIDPGSVPRNGDYSQRGGKFTFDTKRPERWANAKDIWISGFFHYGYADDAVKIANLDLDKKIITTVQETLYGFQGGKKFQSWYAYNLLEEIDQPGEYFIDRNSGMLYFLPPSESLTSIELSVLETPLVTIENGSYIQFRNITFECARGMGIYIEQGQGNRIENCIFRNLGLVAVSLGKGVQPLNPLQHAGSGKPASRILGSISNHLYDNPTFNREAGTDHVISGCHIYNIGAGGINLSGGDRLTLKKGKNIVENCQINNFNRLDRSYKAGVNIDGVGNIIRNCEIYNCPGSAILLHGNDHLIELNNIHHAVTDGDDMGAIYYGRDPSELGNIVKHNFFHHIGNDHGLIVSVYHDDGACGMEVTGNVFYKAGSKSVLIGGGHDNVYRNNIFINADIAFHLDNRQQNWAKGNLVKDGIFEKRLKAVNYKLPPYAAAYPKIARYFEDSPALPKGNLIENNVFVNVKMIHNGAAEWSYFGINYIADKDPGFVNYEDMNFELNVSSDIFKVLPGFKPIPFHKIGLLRETDSYEMNK
ncbi:right-handed parallel beta-helix repeat-containing protein [Pedobacter nyackensis]|uniref:right-handed parallel beta-helix repeat-containing protein n=1 Tax=Pedobacter nyackensis TaxID=475255 RepID=UPI00292F4F09|nr:right-handed parallel beta-helix repeat-containing protein [Pedobacter nyackensis]